MLATDLRPLERRPTTLGIAQRLKDLRVRYLDRSIRDWVREHGNELEQQLMQAGETGSLVQVTLENRKVYVGRVNYVPGTHEGADSHLAMELYASGYRDEQHLAVSLPNQYVAVRKHAADDFTSAGERLRSLDPTSATAKERTEAFNAYQSAAQELRQVNAQLKVIIPFDRILSVTPYDPTIRTKLTNANPNQPPPPTTSSTTKAASG